MCSTARDLVLDFLDTNPCPMCGRLPGCSHTPPDCPMWRFLEEWKDEIGRLEEQVQELECDEEVSAEEKDDRIESLERDLALRTQELESLRKSLASLASGERAS